MQNDIVLTCAVTGAGDTTRKSAHVPVTPKDIAKAAIDAAKAGASIAHIHARDPETCLGSRDPKLFKEIVDMVFKIARRLYKSSYLFYIYWISLHGI